MPRVTFISPNGERTEIDAPTGISLMMAAITNGIDGIEAECGGALACGICHVYGEGPEPSLPAIAAPEEDMLGAIEGGRRPCSRLSCQIPLTLDLDGLMVRVPPPQG